MKEKKKQTISIPTIFDIILMWNECPLLQNHYYIFQFYVVFES